LEEKMSSIYYKTNKKGEVISIGFNNITKNGRTFVVPQMIDITDAKTPQEIYDRIMKYEENSLDEIVGGKG
jgi:hypothetical protein